MLEITHIASQSEAPLEALVEILCDSVNGGSSVGFLPPFSAEESAAYWQSVLPGVQDGSRVLLVARLNDAVIGTAQLALESKPNGNHRAEVCKVLVHSSARRQGVAKALMLACERETKRLGRSLLFLDTWAGCPAEALYQSLGYSFVGNIPQYARAASGALEANAIYYKLLTA